MGLSLLQVHDRLKSLALAHHQVNSFYFGDPWEFVNRDLDYPACFVEQLPGSLSSLDKLQRFNFRVYFLDLVGVSKETEQNETDVLSDMDQVGRDYLSMLMSTTYQDDWEIVETAGVTPLTEVTEDMAAGVFLDIGVEVDFLADRCQVPAEDVEFETEFEMARTRILPYTGTGLEGDSFTVTGLSGKNVLAAYRSTTYKRVITTVPTDSDKIKVTGTDLGSRKGILSSDGTVALASGDGLVSGEVLDFLIYE